VDGALDDNLDVLNKTDDEAGEGAAPATRDLIRSRIKVKSLNFHGGPHVHPQVPHHRRGPEPDAQADERRSSPAPARHKVVCLGNIAQIDTPYLTRQLGLT